MGDEHLQLLVSCLCSMYGEPQYKGIRMDAEKTVGLTFRVTPRMKRMLEAAAEHDRRSLTNMFEVLVEDFCERNGVALDEVPRQEAVDSRKRAA